ncbi:hypothetical protein Lgee_0087 [Legionella geestiana]|uniref:Uncharacterized protein n=1 Tax=Legionella geestiana TaxID=45065 RepID=A0A0W0U9Z3_9GAMM|nr:hypothetical protein [Legionella geestiana]KTD04477.1 hypothetical protein Lgee_0087 [Legionella geestiana]QBS12247.1 hypothetical protein E4T54_05525 [Legionella geestiana]STX53019.1 Uncharacterised protein [Legionella geestiana]
MAASKESVFEWPHILIVGENPADGSQYTFLTQIIHKLHQHGYKSFWDFERVEGTLEEERQRIKDKLEDVKTNIAPKIEVLIYQAKEKCLELHAAGALHSQFPLWLESLFTACTVPAVKATILALRVITIRAINNTSSFSLDNLLTQIDELQNNTSVHIYRALSTSLSLIEALQDSEFCYRAFETREFHGLHTSLSSRLAIKPMTQYELFSPVLRLKEMSDARHTRIQQELITQGNPVILYCCTQNALDFLCRSSKEIRQRLCIFHVYNLQPEAKDKPVFPFSELDSRMQDTVRSHRATLRLIFRPEIQQSVDGAGQTQEELADRLLEMVQKKAGNFAVPSVQTISEPLDVCDPGMRR